MAMATDTQFPSSCSIFGSEPNHANDVSHGSAPGVLLNHNLDTVSSWNFGTLADDLPDDPTIHGFDFTSFEAAEPGKVDESNGSLRDSLVPTASGAPSIPAEGQAALYREDVLDVNTPPCPNGVNAQRTLGHANDLDYSNENQHMSLMFHTNQTQEQLSRSSVGRQPHDISRNSSDMHDSIVSENVPEPQGDFESFFDGGRLGEDEDSPIPDQPEHEAEAQNEIEPRNYHLRPGFRDNGLVFSTWLDKDTSGDYDPDLKPTRSTARRRKLIASGDDSSAELVRPTEITEARQLLVRQRRLSEAAARINGKSYVLSFKLSSEKGLALIASSLDNWPDHEWNAFAEPLHNHILSDSTSDGNISSLSFQKGYKLRGRPVQTQASHRPDLKGQPAARGCWNCYEVGLLDNKCIVEGQEVVSCSLVNDGTNWPCRACVEDGHDCDLITAPIIKKTCECCTRRRLDCSYARTFDHSNDCLECQSIGHRCVAGPHKAAVYQRISLDHTPSPASITDHTSLSCTACLAGDTFCTLWSEFENKTGRACRECEKCGLRCIIAGSEGPKDRAVIEAERRKKRKRKPAAESAEDKTLVVSKRPRRLKPQIPFIEDEDDKDNDEDALIVPKGVNPGRARAPHSLPIPDVLPKTKTITTKLCHPITFNYEEDPEGKRPCHFCSLPKYPVLGLGERAITVFDDNRSLASLFEHGERDQEPTRICAYCTNKPLKILVCNPHDIRRIPEDKMAITADFCGAFTRLLKGELLPTDHWCSICPAPATYQCCKRRMGFGSEEDGCGLLLCDLCHEQLTSNTNGGSSLGEFVSGLPITGTEERPFGMRADAELLKDGGEFTKFISRM